MISCGKVKENSQQLESESELSTVCSCASLVDSGGLLELVLSESQCCLIEKWKWIINNLDYAKLSSCANLTDSGRLSDF